MPVGVAVVGCGSTARRRHLPVWASLPGARLAAVVSRDAGRREEAARTYGALRAYADWRDALADPDVDAIDICLPHPNHTDVAIAAARAGKHILCEKPLATTLGDGRRMVEAAQTAGVVLMPFHNMRLGGAARRAIELVRGGAIGRPTLVRGVMAHGGPDASDPTRQWFLDASSGGGAVLDLGPHMFDLLAVAMPTRAQRLRANLRSVSAGSVEKDGLLDIEFQDGAVAQIALSWSHVAGRETRLVLQGERGVLQLNLLLAPDPSPNGPTAPLVLATAGPPAAVQYPDPAESQEPCSLFLRSIAGTGSGVTAEDGLETMRYVDAAYRSQRSDGAWAALNREVP